MLRSAFVLSALLATNAAALTAQPVDGPRGSIRIRGSDTMLLLVQRWSEGFMTSHPGISVEVRGGGTTKGLEALIAGEVDIASASRPLRPDEAQRMLERHGSLGFSVLAARDALSVYVHPANPIRDLTLEQLRAIFTGRVQRWSQLGAERTRADEIMVVNRSPASGSRLFFREHVLLGERYTRRARVRPTTANVAAAVAAAPGAIGYGGIGLAEGVRLLEVEGVAPSFENIRNGAYPISRYLYLYISAPPAGLVKQFIDWMLGDDGQRVVAEVGYVPLRDP